MTKKSKSQQTYYKFKVRMNNFFFEHRSSTYIKCFLLPFKHLGLMSSLFHVPSAFPTNWEVSVVSTKPSSHSYVMFVPTTLANSRGFSFTTTLPFSIAVGSCGSSVTNIVVRKLQILLRHWF